MAKITTDVVNADGIVPRESLRVAQPEIFTPEQPLTRRVATESSPEALTQVPRAPTVSPCPKLDPVAKHCHMMNISAETTMNQAKEAICIRQTNRWLGNNLACRVPEILTLKFSHEYAQNKCLGTACVQVLNGVSLEDRCPHAQAKQYGPMCLPLNLPCVQPESHARCKVHAAIGPNANINGPRAFVAAQRAYDAEISIIEGRTISRVDPGMVPNIGKWE